tara:strand:+ start:545 stop:763 length:219 start_codon:yes stop_codon:yes gene_type:complete
MHSIVNIMHNSIREIILQNISQNNEDSENTPPNEKEMRMFEPPYQNPFNILIRGRPSCVCTFIAIRRIKLID